MFKSLAGWQPGCSAPSRLHPRTISLCAVTEFPNTHLCDGDGGSTPAKHLNTFLNFNCALRTSEGMITHVPKCEQHRKSQSQKCGNAPRSVWVNVFHMCLKESCPGAVPGGGQQHFLPPLHFLRLAGLLSRLYQK